MRFADIREDADVRQCEVNQLGDLTGMTRAELNHRDVNIVCEAVAQLGDPKFVIFVQRRRNRAPPRADELRGKLFGRRFARTPSDRNDLTAKSRAGSSRTSE